MVVIYCLMCDINNKTTATNFFLDFQTIIIDQKVDTYAKVLAVRRNKQTFLGNFGWKILGEEKEKHRVLICRLIPLDFTDWSILMEPQIHLFLGLLKGTLFRTMVLNLFDRARGALILVGKAMWYPKV